MDIDKSQFASDNYAGICPQALQAMLDANAGFQAAYGEDRWTQEACDRFREIFETDCEVFFVFNGTAANSLAVSAMCHSYYSIVCHELSHMETDECGAPEFFSNGAKLLVGGGENGKLTPHSLQQLVTKRTDIHYPRPRVVSVTQPTEVGTVYSVEELKDLWAMARTYGLSIHMDGARLANALDFLQVSPREITWECGVDVLCLGGTKNGMAVGEAVIFFDRAKAEDFDYRCKQAGQLGSKMRYLAAPWVGMLRDGAWLENARRANACACLLDQLLREIPEVEIMFPRQANAVFVTFPPRVTAALHARGWSFYSFIGTGGARLMCSWASTEEGVRAFVQDVKDVLAG
ncbi:threonine aldolase family protein [Desulfovermiculus halophilus]|jgi:threonine aldolase|uniref:threonine aldolase family protein n=1 Tax=Desulfovermiculus halophilus TaxID=339722 RepID=UPI0004809196|nr:low specificity L-threonine aldolase [Desulfovermiculus halophilus]